MLLVSLELEEILSLSDRILVMYEGAIVAEYGPDVDGGRARHRDDRRHGEGRGGGMSEQAPTPAPPPAEPGGYAPSVAARFAIYQRAGGIVDAARSRPSLPSSSPAWSSSSERQEPTLDVPGDLQRYGAQLVLSVGLDLLRP